MGLFTYDKPVDEAATKTTCEVRVYPLLVKRQSKVGRIPTANDAMGGT